MKKYLLYTTCYLLLATPSTAQNLVPNNSFENKIQCPPSDDYFTGYVANWTGRGGGAPCYFTSLCSGPGYDVGVPSNGGGHQYAHSGVAYAGIYTYFDSALVSPPFINDRGYIQDSLLSPLIGGKKYYVTFYVSLADTFSYACNNIGAYFSDSALVWSDGHVKPYLHPQVSNDTAHNPLTSKINWTRVSGSFVAAGGEQYIIIGNFVNDRNSDATFVNANPNGQYDTFYYIDDVIVSTDSTYADSLFTGINELKQNDANANIYPNPASTLLNVAVNMTQLKAGSICLYSPMGKEVRCINLSGNITSISISDLPSGMYYYRITDVNGSLVKSDKVVIVK